MIRYFPKILFFRIFLPGLLLLFLLFSISSEGRVYYRNGVVSSANELASEVGIKILKSGGNAVDAAVGTAFALAVVYPQAGNIGGGGFLVLHTSDGKNISLDFRETAPGLATENMFLDSQGNVIEDLSTLGVLAAGVPGSVAGLLEALDKFGTKSRKEILSYAIELAENGFPVNDELSKALNNHREEFKSFPGSRAIFGKKFKKGNILFQKDLASTLKEISENGKDGFYKGWVADRIVDEMKRGGGIISYYDLENYKPQIRETVIGTYRDFKIISMGPPSSGGISLVYLLNILENYNLKSLGYGKTLYLNLLAESMKRVYADRSEFMGDQDFVSVPVDILTSKKYAATRMKGFEIGSLKPSTEIRHGEAYYRENTQTTHISVADKFGNAVSLTTTLNDVFGNKVVVKGAGFLLNNEMDDFSIKSGVPNIYGLIGNTANAISPNKRMLSSMTPTVILKENKPYLVVGSPGGGRIITSVLQVIINLIDFEMELSDAVDFPRMHHQWLPDIMQVESGLLDNTTYSELLLMGYNIKETSDFGRIEAILFSPLGMIGHSDRRGSGKALGY